MENYLPRGEHEEFVKRMEEEHHRINKRVGIMEENFRQIQSLTISVEKMAFSMESMAKEQARQCEKLEALEAVPKDNWNALKFGVLGAISTAIGGGIVLAIINFIK